MKLVTIIGTRTVGLIACFILTSCTLLSQEIHTTSISNKSNSGIVLSTGSLQKNITWTGELSFPDCNIINNQNLNPEIIELAKKVELYADESQKLDNQRYIQTLASGSINPEYYLQANWSPFFGRFLREYCSTGDGKYIFYSDDKVSPSFGRYDSSLGIIEEAIFIRKYFHFVGWFGRSGAFGKRNGDTINIRAETRYPSHPELHPLKQLKNQKYCNNGLTPGGKKAQCSYTVTYEYNFIKNTFTEKNICSYHRDDLDREQVLESCFDVKY